MAINFQAIYVEIAEATAASRDALTSAVEPISDTNSYLSTGKDGNVKTIVDVTIAPNTFLEDTISEVQFEVDTLAPANSTWTEMQDLSLSNTPYNAIVTALNNFVINNVLGEATDNATSIDSLYQTTLQDFMDIDCDWDEDPSAGAGAPTAWIELMQSNGYNVVDTHPDNA